MSLGHYFFFLVVESAFMKAGCLSLKLRKRYILPMLNRNRCRAKSSNRRRRARY